MTQVAQIFEEEKQQALTQVAQIFEEEKQQALAQAAQIFEEEKRQAAQIFEEEKREALAQIVIRMIQKDYSSEEIAALVSSFSMDDVEALRKNLLGGKK